MLKCYIFFNLLRVRSPFSYLRNWTGPLLRWFSYFFHAWNCFPAYYTRINEEYNETVMLPFDTFNYLLSKWRGGGHMEIFFLWDSRLDRIVSVLLAGINCLCAELSSMSPGCKVQRCKAIHLHLMKPQTETQVSSGSEQMWFHVKMKHCCSLSSNYHIVCQERFKAKAHQSGRELSPLWTAQCSGCWPLC